MAKKSPDKVALEQLASALADVVRLVEAGGSANLGRRVRQGLAEHVAAIEQARAVVDPVQMPMSSFDPSNPKTIGRVVALALLAQPRVPLASIKPAYGSGVYAIYYQGDHPLYARIAGSETPIYVGKADPADSDASTPREQGPRLTGRLIEHAGTIETAERYASNAPEFHATKLADFTCRRLVCATNAQLVAEKHLISMFWPLWNSETKACWGMSKHGDAAKTRANKRSPWDVVHPGRIWALDAILKDSLTLEEISARVDRTLDRVPPRVDHASLLEEVLVAFRQQHPDPSIEPLVPPVGDVAGPDEDEAGGQDD